MILDVRKIGPEYRVTVDHRVSLRFMSLTPHHDGPTAILEALDLTIGGKPHVDRISLLSSRTRGTLAATLAKRWAGPVWSDILDDACFEVHRLMSEGDPPAELTPEEPTDDAWLIEGIIPLDDITVLYADGGSMKSWFALALAVAARRGEPLAPAARWCVRLRESVLYLDWETDQHTHARRLWRLYQGLGITSVSGVHYLNLRGHPLHTALTALTSSVAKLGVDLIIVDSLGMACGDEPETALANLRTLGALSSLPGTKLVLTHVNALTASATQAPGRPYGSVFIRNTARSAIEARAEPEEHGALVTYYHRKANDTALQKPLAIRWEFDSVEKAVRLYNAAPDLQHATIADQIWAALEIPRSVASLAEIIDRSETQIRVELHRMRKRNRVDQVATDTIGRGHEALWCRVDRMRSEVPF